jgi:hypothetical protein
MVLVLYFGRAPSDCFVVPPRHFRVGLFATIFYDFRSRSIHKRIFAFIPHAIQCKQQQLFLKDELLFTFLQGLFLTL